MIFLRLQSKLEKEQIKSPVFQQCPIHCTTVSLTGGVTKLKFLLHQNNRNGGMKWTSEGIKGQVQLGLMGTTTLAL